MKILQALHFYFPQHSAGTEVYTRRLCQGLRPKHEVALFFTEKVHSRRQGTRFFRQWKEDPCHVYVNNFVYESFAATYENAAVESQFSALLDEWQPDILHFQHLMFLSLGLVRLAQERGIPTVMTLHDFWLVCPRMGQLVDRHGQLCPGPEARRCASCLADFKFGQTPVEAKLLDTVATLKERVGVDISRPLLWAKQWQSKRRNGSAKNLGPTPLTPSAEDLQRRAEAIRQVMDAVDLFVSPSQTVLEAAVAGGVERDKIYWLPNGFLRPPHAARRIRRKDPQQPFRVGFVGTLAPHKGVHILIEAFRKADLPNATLEIYGTARHNPEYGAMLTAAHSPNVLFHGRVKNDLVVDVMKTLDVLVVPSMWLENAPVTIQEGRFAGVPVVATDLGGMAEMIEDGVTGRLFPMGDSDRLATILRELHDDPEGTERLAQQAPAPMPMEQHVHQLEKLYAKLRVRPAP